MRFIIIGLSIIFFALSALITFRALGLPVHNTSYQDSRENRTSDSTDVIHKLTEEQNSNKSLVADLQATIARLEDKLTTKEEALKNAQSTASDNRTRTLAVFGGGTFRSGQDVINDISFSTIENLVSEISANQDSRVIIEGHTDNIPIKSSAGRRYRDNMDLSYLRAKAIANILTFHGISSDRISVIGYGDTRPVDTNDTAAGRAKNRRVEVKLVPGKGDR
jgi:flagellar motor protein MotB